MRFGAGAIVSTCSGILRIVLIKKIIYRAGYNMV